MNDPLLYCICCNVEGVDVSATLLRNHLLVEPNAVPLIRHHFVQFADTSPGAIHRYCLNSFVDGKCHAYDDGKSESERT